MREKQRDAVTVEFKAVFYQQNRQKVDQCAGAFWNCGPKQLAIPNTFPADAVGKAYNLRMPSTPSSPPSDLSVENPLRRDASGVIRVGH